MLLQKQPIGYFEDGMITILLFAGEGKSPRSYAPLSREEVQRLLDFPKTTSLHLYNVTETNIEEVIALLRFIKSLYNTPIFCYHDYELSEGSRLTLDALANKLIMTGAIK